MTHLQQPTTLASRRSFRFAATADLAETFDGVANREQLRGVGVSRDDVRHEVSAGRWTLLGNNTVAVRSPRGPRAMWWRAIWETHGSPRLDGVTALLSYGMTGWEEALTHVSIPHGTNITKVQDVRIHVLRHEPEARDDGLPRVCPEWAALHAASWAATDRAATTLLAMVVQQRITTGARLGEVLSRCPRIRRIRLLRGVIADVSSGAHALSEVDFARLCRTYRIPEPSRQVVRQGPTGRIYLDVSWDAQGVVVEIDGLQHTRGLAMVDDALRDNHLTLNGSTVLRIPALGLRTNPAAFMNQIKAALHHNKNW